MSFIDRNLLPDERILYRTNKHLIIFLPSVLWMIAALFFYFNSNPYVVKIAIAPVIAALLTGANTLLNYLTSEFAVTDKRIMMKEGFFFRHSNEMRLTTISNVSVNQSLLAQVLNYGTLVINPFGGNNDVFTEISRPMAFQQQVQMQLDQKK